MVSHCIYQFMTKAKQSLSERVPLTLASNSANHRPSHSQSSFNSRSRSGSVLLTDKEWCNGRLSKPCLLIFRVQSTPPVSPSLRPRMQFSALGPAPSHSVSAATRARSRPVCCDGNWPNWGSRRATRRCGRASVPSTRCCGQKV